MRTFQKHKLLYDILAMILSGVCWYLANDLSGHFGIFMWIAPAPVLWVSLSRSWQRACFVSFSAAMIGKLSWLSYLVSVISPIPALIFMITGSLALALVVVLSRLIVLKIDQWYSVFVFPALFTFYEFAVLKWAPHGTAGSIAYSQMNDLPIIQVASLTGILGITFLLTLVPSAIALSWFYRPMKNRLRRLILIPGIIFVSAFLFGIIRIAGSVPPESIMAGAVVLDEDDHHITDHPDMQKERITAVKYAKEITELAGKGARLVVLPERAISITRANEKEILQLFCNTSRQNAVGIVLGYTNFRTDTPRNSSLVIDTSGRIVEQYDKSRLIPVLEGRFKPGDHIGVFMFDGRPAGTAICKDLDFPDYIERYSQPVFLAIPAWDFGVDGWLHGRMAVLRSVENGFSMIRAARRGRLTISDCFGRVSYESDCSDRKKATLIGNLPIEKRNTFYGRFGDWFGLFDGLLMTALIFLAFWRRKNGI